MMRLALYLFLGLAVAAAGGHLPATAAEPPNILFAIADDWGWPHAGAYGDPVVQTPTFDRLAREGILFQHAYVSSPSCTPSRNAILTGMWHWQLESGANLWSVFPDKFPTYGEVLSDVGYFVGSTGKAYGPGRTESQDRRLMGERQRNFEQFLERRPPGRPFCFWLGSSDPHRPYRLGSGVEAGMDLAEIRLPACFPDAEVVRSDVADYYFEVQRFDRLVGDAVRLLEQRGELDNTIIVMTGDHGMPFPRCKANLYDSGSRVPLAIRWPAAVKPGRVAEDFVSLTDLAPTFLDAAGLGRSRGMSGRSLLPLLQQAGSGRLDPQRDFVLIGKERHVPGQERPNLGGYPCRAIRTHDHLYIINFAPDRWPAGTPNHQQAAVAGAWLADCDNGPTKSFLVEHREGNAEQRRSYDLCFGKRPAEELYDLGRDPHQLNNVAGMPAYAAVQQQLRARLLAHLTATRDPRVWGQGRQFDEYPYLGGAPKHPAAAR